MQVPTRVLHLLGSHGKHRPKQHLHSAYRMCIDEVENMCTAYFNTVNTWAPIVSKKRLLARLEKFSSDADASMALLLLSMKLVTQILSESDDPRTWLYWTCRQFYIHVEDTPLLSLALLQAKLLIAQYEIGHGIYPAGFLSVGHAVRLGYMMGFHDRKNAPQLFKPPPTWTGREEERRTWWGVVVLDRCVVAGPLPCSD